MPSFPSQFDCEVVFLRPRMKQSLKQLTKRILSSMGIHLTQNQRYDALTEKIMRKCIQENSNCIDVGAHRGEVLERMLDLAPKGQHFAFEPIPELHAHLLMRYPKGVSIHAFALSDSCGSTSFQHVVSNPAYSGMRQRSYENSETIEEIAVEKRKLDEVLPADYRIDFLKIDVEGAEYQVLKGGIEHIKASKPVIIFEHGLGASEHYGTNPEMLYDLLSKDCALKISLLEDFVAGNSALDQEAFKAQFYKKLNYYFVAHP